MRDADQQDDDVAPDRDHHGPEVNDRDHDQARGDEAPQRTLDAPTVYEENRHIQYSVYGFDYRVLDRNLRSAVSALPLKEKPAEQRKQVIPLESVITAHAVRVYGDYALLFRNTDNTHIQKAPDQYPVYKYDRCKNIP